MDEREIEGLNGPGEASLAGSAEIVLEDSFDADPFTEPDPIHGMSEIWGSLEGETDAAYETGGSPAAASSSGAENPLRRFASGTGEEISSRISPQRRDGLLRRALRTRTGKVALGGALVSFLYLYGTGARNESDRKAAAEWVQADLVRLDGFEVAARLNAAVDQGTLKSIRGRAGDYKRGATDASWVIREQMIAASSGNAEVQAGLIAEFLERRTPYVRRNVEALIQRARKGEKVSEQMLLQALDPIAAPIEGAYKAEGMFRMMTWKYEDSGRKRSVRIPVSRDARLAKAIIPTYEIEQMIRLHLGQEGIARQLNRAIAAEAEVLKAGAREIPAGMFGPSDAFPILSRVSNAGVLLPTGSSEFEAGANASLHASLDALRGAVLPQEAQEQSGFKL